jgi:hypothetical protein
VRFASIGGVPIIFAKVVTNARENCQGWFDDRRGAAAAQSRRSDT